MSDDDDDAAKTPRRPSRVDMARQPSAQVEAFDRKRKQQEDLKDGLLKFNLKPKHGLDALHKTEHLDKTSPRSVARFLLEHKEGLDKTVVGDYLGKEEQYQDGFCVKVLHEYADALDFNGLEFDVAIRHFLAGFRLPGEAQKIDRIMEKFAERYTAQNKGVFQSADVAFVLAFSVIMLQTDLHNPAIKEEKKMTKDGFRRNNRGISNGQDLDAQFLDDIFDRIKAAPITLKEDEQLKERMEREEKSAGAHLAAQMSAAFGLSGSTPQRRKAEAFSKEREDIFLKSHNLLKKGRPAFAAFQDSSSSKPETRALASDAAPRMFEVAWGPALSAFSHALERIFHGPTPTHLALRGLKISATIGCALGLEVASMAVVNALASFTTLYGPGRSLLPRHAACVETLLSLATLQDCAEHLGASWLPILRVASKVAHLRLIAQGARTDDQYFGADGKVPKDMRDARAREEENARALAQHSTLTDAQLDALYARSTRLSAVGVEHFVTQLCAVSAAELSTGDALDLGTAEVLGEADLQPGGIYDDAADLKPLPPLGAPARPRIFSLQRLVDVADANVNTRPRLAWDRMWRVLAAHFARAGAHANADVAQYAVDSLRQLSLKFLAKEELKAFTFQRSFLRPFERIFRANADKKGARTRAPVREYVVACADVLVQAKASKIKSGWRSILHIFAAAAGDPEPGVADAAFAALGRILDLHLDLVAGDFVDVVNCAVAFAATGSKPGPRATALALAALTRLDACSRALADGTVRDAAARLTKDEGPEDAAPPSDEAQLELWWPLLLGLAQRVADPREAVRNGALATLRRVLGRDCGAFSAETWRLVFRGVLFPALESAWTDDAPRPGSTWPTDAAPPAQGSGGSWLDTTAPGVLDCCVALYAARGGGRENTPLLGEMLALLGDCVCQDAEALSRLAVSSLRSTLDALPNLDPPASPDAWDVACHGLAHLVERALPPDLKSRLLPNGEKPDAAKLAKEIRRAPCLARLVASLRLLPLAGDLLTRAAARGALTESGADALLRAMAASRHFAANFGRDPKLRAACQQHRLMGADPPDLVAQQVGAGGEAFRALRAAHADPRSQALAEPRLLGLCRDLLREYARSERDSTANASYPMPASLLESTTPLALEALAFVRDLDADAFSKHCAWLVPVLSELIVCQSVALRTTVAAVFATRLPSALLSTTRPSLVQAPSDPVAGVEAVQPQGDDTPAKGGVSARHPGTVAKPYNLFSS